MNPGPGTDDLSCSLASVETVHIIEGQDAILRELQGVKKKQEATDFEIKRLSERVRTLEATCASLASTETASTAFNVSDITNQLKNITSRCEDTENRMRRSNILFCGIEDDEKEDWTASELKIQNFCSQKLDRALTSLQFDRVHRLGRFVPNKCWPITAKMTSVKDKQSILGAARKLKGSTFSIREGFSLSTRQARKKLLEFARAQAEPFKLSVDKLRIDRATYVFDSSNNSVVLSTQ